jgi:phospholipase/lecithinase/hemolysin
MIQLAYLSVATALLFRLRHCPTALQRLIVFGDSKSDNGKLYPDQRLGHAALLRRFSNSPLWVEQLWERLRLAGHSTESDPRPAPSEAGGSNYAYGGAESGPGFSRESCIVVDGTKTCAVNIGLQIEYFFAGGGTLDGDELIIVQGGANNTSAVLAAHYMGEHIATLANAGSKVFLVPNLTRLNTTPGARPEWETRWTPLWPGSIRHWKNSMRSRRSSMSRSFDSIGWRLKMRSSATRRPSA